MVRELQPGACMFSDGGPDIRWAGAEDGIAGDPCWATLDAGGFGPGYGPSNDYSTRLNSGDRHGTNWLPAECDVSIRPGWFYHPGEDDKVKTPGQLLERYFHSVGRGATLLLNVPPDRRGQINEHDAASLREFRRRRDAIFGRDLAKQAKVSASNTRGGSARFSAENVIRGRPGTYWSTDDGVTTPEMVLDLGKAATFNVVRLREFLPLGQRIEAFALDQWRDGQWAEFASGTSVGHCRLIRGPAITTTKVRLRITKAPVCPALAEVGLFGEPGTL
jgi:alpha-L-fucosidase